MQKIQAEIAHVDMAGIHKNCHDVSALSCILLAGITFITHM